MAGPEGQEAQAAAPKKPARRGRPVVTINPLFKLLIWINAGLCLVSFMGMVVLALFAREPMTRAQETLSTACETVFKMTAGAFIGLPGGRAAAPDRIESPPQPPQQPASP